MFPVLCKGLFVYEKFELKTHYTCAAPLANTIFNQKQVGEKGMNLLEKTPFRIWIYESKSIIACKKMVQLRQQNRMWSC